MRFVDPDLTGRMVEYVALHVLYHHRRMSEFRELQARKVWKYLPEPAAHEVRVGLMGLGVLGSAAAARAQGLRLSGAGLEPVAEIASPVLPATPAKASSMPSWPTPTSWPCCCR